MLLRVWLDVVSSSLLHACSIPIDPRIRNVVKVWRKNVIGKLIYPEKIRIPETLNLIG